VSESIVKADCLRCCSVSRSNATGWPVQSAYAVTQFQSRRNVFRRERTASFAANFVSVPKPLGHKDATTFVSHRNSFVANHLVERKHVEVFYLCGFTQRITRFPVFPNKPIRVTPRIMVRHQDRELLKDNGLLVLDAEKRDKCFCSSDRFSVGNFPVVKIAPPRCAWGMNTNSASEKAKEQINRSTFNLTNKHTGRVASACECVLLFGLYFATFDGDTPIRINNASTIS
jgi:hypothetical protein